MEKKLKLIIRGNLSDSDEEIDKKENTFIFFTKVEGFINVVLEISKF